MIFSKLPKEYPTKKERAKKLVILKFLEGSKKRQIVLHPSSTKAIYTKRENSKVNKVCFAKNISGNNN